MEATDPKAVKAKEVAEAIFEKFDADHSGAIERDEAKEIFTEVLKKMQVTKINVTEAMLDQWFGIADVNKDGKISKEEAEVFVRDHMMGMF